MAYFQILVQGRNGSERSTLGNKDTVMVATVQGWHGRVNVTMWHDPKRDTDMVRVTFGPHSADGDPVITLFEGETDCWKAQLAMQAQRIFNKHVTTGVDTSDA